MSARPCSPLVLVVSLLAAASQDAAAQTPAFAANANVSTGTFASHRGVALADVSGDGKLDLIVTRADNSNNPGDVEVLTGNGSGAFTVATNKVTSGSPTGIAVGDLNLDGKPDLAVAVDNVGIRVLIATGGGAYNNPTALSGGNNSPRAIVIADFNRDGSPDIAATQNSAAQVSIFLATSPGVFAAATSVNVGANPVGITAGDFNRDGIIDLAVANNGTNTVTVLTGNGSGGFTGASFGTASGAFAVATGDLNRDGRLDLVVANRTANSFSTLLGGVSPAFGAALTRSLPTNSEPSAVALADFNADGHLDALFSTEQNSQLHVYSGTALGVFGASSSFNRFTGGTQPRAVATGDVNGDGRPDIITVGFASTNATLLVNSTTLAASGTFADPATITFSNGTAPAGLAPADLNRDGVLDLAVALSGSAGGTNDQGFWTLHGSGDGGFAPGVAGFRNNAGALADAAGIAALDFTRDGTLDLVVTHAGSDAVELTPGAAFETFQVGGIGDFPRAVAVGDFNRDGFPDSAIANTNSNTVSIVSGNGFSITNVALASGQAPVDLAAGDIDGNGTTDLAVANQTGSNIAILLGNGAGGFSVPTSFPVSGGAFAVALGDFNGDSRLDLAAAGNGVVHVLLASGTAGTFALPVAYGAGAAPSSVAVADFNRDGKLDLAVANFVSGSVSVLPGVGDGTFSAKTDYAVGSGPKAVVAGDFNRDGRVDVAVAGSLANTLSILLNGGFTLNITRAGTGAGSVLSATAINCGTDCAQFFDAATDVTLTASTGAGSFFASWSEPACTAPGPCTVSVSTNTAITATFSPTSLTFTDEPLVAQSTVVKLVHVTELQQAVNTVRQNRGLPTITFTAPTSGATIARAHVVALRDAIDGIYDALSRTRPQYTDPDITVQSTAVKAAHLMELRWAVAAVQ
jgi:hypothetical protein